MNNENETTYTEVILGKDLDKTRIDLMKPSWDHEGEKSLDQKYKTFYEKDFFFLVRSKNDNSVLSMGRLRPFSITFQDQNYQILGISDITSIIQSHGYGKILLATMINFLNKDQRTAIGFCAHHNEMFYKKGGIGVLRDSVDRFLYWNGKKLIPEKDEDEDVIYYEGKDKLIQKVLEFSDEKVIISTPHW